MSLSPGLQADTLLHLQVSSAGSSLLATPPALPLGFGMLGSLVPVSLPFQFPPLLNFSPPGASGAAGIGSAPNSNSGYALAQSDLMGEWGGQRLLWTEVQRSEPVCSRRPADGLGAFEC